MSERPHYTTNFDRTNLQFTSPLPPHPHRLLDTMTPLAFFGRRLVPNGSIPTPHLSKFRANSPIAAQPDVPTICRTRYFAGNRPDLLASPRFVLCPHWRCFVHGLRKFSCTVGSSCTDMIHVVVMINDLDLGNTYRVRGRIFR
jgi:hypothetical protein